MSSDSSSQKSVSDQDKTTKILGTSLTALLGFALYIVPQIIAALAVIYIIGLAGLVFIQAENLAPDSPGVHFLYIVITEALVISFIFYLMRLSNESWRSIAVRRPKIKHFLYIVGGFIAYYAVYVGIAALLANFLNFDQRQEIGFNTDVVGIGLVMAFISLVILPPIVEEILFRGFLYSRFRKYLSIKPAAIILSLLFAAAHLQLGSGNALLWVAALDTFILSLVLVYIREKTGNIWAGVGIHALKNSVAFVVLFILKV